MKYSDLISGIFWLTVGLLLSLWSIRYQIGNLINPGSGFFPFLLGILLIFLSLVLLIGQTKKLSLPTETISYSTPWVGSKKVAYTSLILLLATFLFEKIGYLLTIFLLIIFLMYGAGSRGWKTILFIAFFSAMGVYLVFVLLLKQLYPLGLLGI